VANRHGSEMQHNTTCRLVGAAQAQEPLLIGSLTNNITTGFSQHLDTHRLQKELVLIPNAGESIKYNQLDFDLGQRQSSLVVQYNSAPILAPGHRHNISSVRTAGLQNLTEETHTGMHRDCLLRNLGLPDSIDKDHSGMHRNGPQHTTGLHDSTGLQSNIGLSFPTDGLLIPQTGGLHSQPTHSLQPTHGLQPNLDRQLNTSLPLCINNTGNIVVTGCLNGVIVFFFWRHGIEYFFAIITYFLDYIIT